MGVLQYLVEATPSKLCTSVLRGLYGYLNSLHNLSLQVAIAYYFTAVEKSPVAQLTLK